MASQLPSKRIPSRMRLSRKLSLVLSMGAMSLLWSTSANGVTLEWTRQLGTSANEIGLGVAADRLGNVYISGGTAGSLDGVNAGGTDPFIAKYDAAGSLLWTRQLSTTGDDYAWNVSPDGLGNVYISTQPGSTDGLGNSDEAYLAKYDDMGNHLWTRQFGAAGSHSSSGVSADGLGNIYISGTSRDVNLGTRDPFLTKYDADGNFLWTRQIATPADEFNTFVAANGLGNVYIAGRTWSSLGGPSAGDIDAWIAQYDANGSQVWTRQFGTSRGDGNYAVATDELGNVYTAGYTLGGMAGPNAGGLDAFVAKYNAEGSLIWTRQLGTAAEDGGRGVSVDGLGNVYVSGYTHGSLGGPNAGGNDVFVAKYDLYGNLSWLHQFGTTRDDRGLTVSADGSAIVYVTGSTDDVGIAVTGSDAFLAKLFDGLSGDFNTDGTVDAADYIVWRNGLGTTYTHADYDAWRANFGRTAAGAAVVAKASSASSVANVPEPVNAALFVLGLLPLFTSNRRGRVAPTKLTTTCLLLLLVLHILAANSHADTFGSGSNQFTMEFVRIGNPGNSADTTGSPSLAGSVPYVYNIGKYEVSRDQFNKASAEGGLGLSTYCGFACNPDSPATYVTWNWAARVVNWMNTSKGFPPAYKFATQPGADNYDFYQYAVLWAAGDAGYNAANPFRNSLAHYFLPSVDEWYKAAFYDPTSNTYFDYPTGSNTLPTAVTSGTDAGTAVYGHDVRQGPADITQAGGLSPYGVMGMAGNVFEWEETEFDLVNSSGLRSRGHRGPSWWGGIATDSSATNRLSRAPDGARLDFGFRVASVTDAIPEPGCVVLLGLGLLTLPTRVRKTFPG
jgi:formylglycine-generating enzyme required for sulfatase activity